MDMLARVATWFAGGDTGISSKAIAAYMCGGDMKAGRSWHSAPSDPADLGRCLRLLEIFPEWKERMPEMASVNDDWARIIPHWDKMAAMMADEVGIDWSKGKKAMRTYEFMASVR
jgi:hypothetical protein